MKNTRKGFTLIELVIVVAIIGILALMIIPNFTTVTEDAKYKTFQSNCKTIQSAIGMYQAAKNGAYPTTSIEEDLKKGGFLQKDPSNEPPGAKYVLTGKGLYAEWKNKDDKWFYYSTEDGFTETKPANAPATGNTGGGSGSGSR